jgi:F-type H+-transporting ATPase subunit delta
MGDANLIPVRLRRPCAEPARLLRPEWPAASDKNLKFNGSLGWRCIRARILPRSDASAITAPSRGMRKPRAAVSGLGRARRSVRQSERRAWDNEWRGGGVSSSASLTAGVAGRYATALFELARESKSIDRLEKDVDALAATLKESADLRDLISSPVYTRADQAAALKTIASRLAFGAELTNTLGVMAANRRLFVLPRTIEAVKGLIAEARGEVSAEVTSARPLTDAQREELARALREKVGRTVKLEERVDEGLIGGLVVRVGSLMIDTSIRSKLARLHNAMKEVG